MVLATKPALVWRMFGHWNWNDLACFRHSGVSQPTRITAMCLATSVDPTDARWKYCVVRVSETNRKKFRSELYLRWAGRTKVGWREDAQKFYLDAQGLRRRAWVACIFRAPSALITSCSMAANTLRSFLARSG